MGSPTPIAAVEDFLRQERLALVGLSHDPQHFSRAVYKELVEHGYDVVPVNPAHAGEEIDGRPVYATVADLPQRVGGVLVMVPAEHAAAVARDCAAAAVPRVWLHRGGGPGSVSEEAVRLLDDAHISTVAGECPLMFLSDAHWVHRLHAWGKKLVGSYPT